MNYEVESMRFIKLKNGDNLVAYTEEADGMVTMTRPLCVLIENDLDEGKQYINVREWIPPMLVKDDCATIPRDEILLVMDVVDSFKDEFIELSKFFYSITPIKKPVKEPGTASEKVVQLRKKKEDIIH